MVELSIDDRIRVARAENKTYRQIARELHVSNSQIKAAIDGEQVEASSQLKKEVEAMEKRLEILRAERYEYLGFWAENKAMFEAVDALKKVGGPRNFVLETWYDWMLRSGISHSRIKLFMTQKESEILDERLVRLRREKRSNLR